MKIRTQQAFVLAKKELFSAFNSIATYGVILFFLLFNSISFFYVQKFFMLNTASLRSYFGMFPLVFTFVIPAITMKSWAEERKLGTAELLLTMPFSEWDLVLGKFIASYSILIVTLLLTIPVPLTLLPMGSFDPGVLVGEYAGAILLGAGATALGLLCSAFSKNQIGAFLSSVVVLFIITMIHQISTTFNLPMWLANFFNYLSLAFHFEGFIKGIIDSRDVLYFLIATGLFLFLNTRVILYRKWR